MNACFISYRHRPSKEYVRVIEDFYETLEGEIVLWMNEQVYLDRKRLEGGDFFNPALATAVCESVCMIAFYTPTYFQLDSMYCAREFKAMEELETRRLNALGAAGRIPGLIIPVIFRGWEVFPQQIKDTRQCYDFEKYNFSSRRRLSQQADARAEIRQIAQLVFNRGRALAAAGVSVGAGCSNFDFPTEEDTRPWLTTLIGGRPQPAGTDYPRQ
jgi:hypothetical protein